MSWYLIIFKVVLIVEITAWRQADDYADYSGSNRGEFKDQVLSKAPQLYKDFIDLAEKTYKEKDPDKRYNIFKRYLEKSISNLESQTKLTFKKMKAEVEGKRPKAYPTAHPLRRPRSRARREPYTSLAVILLHSDR